VPGSKAHEKSLEEGVFNNLRGAVHSKESQKVLGSTDTEIVDKGQKKAKGGAERSGQPIIT